MNFKPFDAHAYLRQKRDKDPSDKVIILPMCRSVATVAKGDSLKSEENVSEYLLTSMSVVENEAPPPCDNCDTATRAQQNYPRVATVAEAFSELEDACPAYVELADWRRAVTDGKRFMERWGETAATLGWNGEEVFGLHTPPENPHRSYNRLSRYDCMGLVWLLRGNVVVAMTGTTASVRHETGTITTHRKESSRQEVKTCDPMV